MRSIDVLLDGLDEAVAAIGDVNFDAFDPVIRLRALERLQTTRRRQVALSHDVIAGLAKEDPADIGGPVHKVVADWLRISCAEARRRVYAKDRGCTHLAATSPAIGVKSTTSTTGPPAATPTPTNSPSPARPTTTGRTRLAHKKTPNGHTEWIPPQKPRPRPTKNQRLPERLRTDGEERAGP
ncbi:hypothetical protein AWC15_16100 [Mycobacterium lacus]|nr:DUF222 domain-containing protein [Mycobacterium lacus]ORW11743.1 hypothetical protein AWC15_16100 [Mycobacterium lacus]